MEVGTAPVVANALVAVKSLFTALNERDVSALLSLLAEDVSYENLGSSTQLRGRTDVGRFYLEALAALPEDAVFVLEGPHGPGTDPWVGDVQGAAVPVLQAGVAWHLERNGIMVPLSRGVCVCWADPATGRLARVWDNPEHTVKLAAPSLTSATWAAPLLRGLGPLALPAALGVNSFLANLATGGSGGSGGDTATPGGRLPSSPGDLASGVLSTLSSMVPFKLPGTPAGSSRGADGRGSAGAGAGAGAGSVGGVGGVDVGEGGVGGGNRAPYRDHAREPPNGGAVATAAAATAATVADVGGGVRTAPNARAASSSPAAAVVRPGGSPAGANGNSDSGSNGAAGGLSGSRAVAASSHAVTAITATAATTALVPPVSAPVASAPVARFASRSPPPAAEPAAVAPDLATGGGGDVAISTRGDPIRMRQLPDRGASFASVTIDDDGGAGAAAVGSGPGSPPLELPSATAAAAAVATASEPPMNPGPAAVASVVTTTAVTVSDSINSLASFDGGAAGGGVGSSRLLPFRAATSFSVNLSGLWEKDTAASEIQAYESMLDVLELGGLQKVTARLIDGLDLLHDESRFEVSFVTVVPFFRVTEKSRFGGSSTMMRRDLRSGRQTSLATRIAGGVLVDMSWEAPLAGSLLEEYLASEDGQRMAVVSNIRIGQRAATAMQIYRRSSRNKSEFLASQRSGYGSMADVLQNQEQQYGKTKY